ncbi:MAG: hypothetical protein AAB676_07595 [Verrucomicrobiota bacterium]
MRSPPPAFHRAFVLLNVLLATLGWFAGPLLAGPPNFDLVGFATVNGLGRNGTTGGAGGEHVHVSALADLARHLESNQTLMVEILNDIDLSPLANANGGFPGDYPTGEILVNSHKTIYSKNGATLRRGTLRIGKGPTGRQNIIVRNLKFRDLWVLDPSGQYDEYGWDYIGIEAGSHHIWIDHCDFDRAYDGMIDLKGGADFVTISWNVFRNQKKCNLVGHSENTAATDRGHLNVTLHHNWYDHVEERMPRMRFGNAHVFNLYCNDLGGKGIQSTTEAATLVENAFFVHPRSGSYPTVEVNGGGTGVVKVVNSVIVNLPGGNVAFRQFGASTFTFNAPFATPVPPYSYALDPVEAVPNIVTNHAGVGKIGFELWRLEQFTPEQLLNTALSGPDAAPAGDGIANWVKYALGLPPFVAATGPLMTLRFENGDAVLCYQRPATAGDVTYRVEVSSDLVNWSGTGLLQQAVSSSAGLEIWEACYATSGSRALFFRLILQR